jgi:Trypsin-like peptidase domain
VVKRLVTGALLLLAGLLMGCAHVPRKATAPGEPSTAGILQLSGRFGSAQACPISPDLALTNAHVTDERPFDAGIPYYPYVWSAGDLTGILYPVKGLVYQYRDLAVMRSDTPFASWYPIAKEAPKPGDSLWLVEYNFDDPEHAWEPRRLKVKAKRVVARTVIYVQGGHQGSSGSCVINAAGELVAVNAWVLDFGSKGSAGLGVGVWGETFALPELKPEKPTTVLELLEGAL